MKYRAKHTFDILETLFVKGSVIYISPNFRPSGGVSHKRNVYDGDGKHIGVIPDEDFEKSIKYKLEEEKE